MINDSPLILSLICMVIFIGLRRSSKRRGGDGAMAKAAGWLRRGNGPRWNGPKWSRLSGVLIAVATASLVAGLVPLQDVLAVWVTSKNGPLLLDAADIALAFGVWLEWWHRHGWDQTGTTITCAFAGPAAAITYMMWPQPLTAAVQIIPGTAAALTKTSHRWGNGKAVKAAHSLTGASHQQYLTFAGIAVVGVLLLVGLGGHHWIIKRARSRGDGGSGGGGRRGGGNRGPGPITAGYGPGRGELG